MADLLEVVDRLYAAALEPERWPDALDHLARAVGGIGTVMRPVATITPPVTVVSPVLHEAAEDFERGWWQFDKATEMAHQRGLTSGVWTDDHAFTPEDMARNPYYQEFLRKHGLGRFLAQLATPLPGYVVSISVQRDIRRGAFESHEMERFALLGGHAARALATTTKLAEAQRLNADLSLVLERLACGVIILDQHGAVTFVNDAAEKLLGDGMTVRHGRVLATTPAEQKDLDRLVASALPLSMSPPHGPVVLTRRSGRRSLFVQAIPVRWNAEDRLQHLALGRGGVLLLLNDVDATPARSVAEKLVLLGLTKGEARLAELIGGGLPPREAAERLGITEGTARAVLKQVFMKLDIARQSELAVLVTKLQSLAT